jgi:outer membrane protein OmpA-like peptidoglycan-associated protein
MCALLVATSVLAEDVPGADVEQQWLDPAGRGSLMVGNGLTLKSLEFRVGAAAFYTHGNLRVGGLGLLSNRLGFQVFGAVGVTDWLEVGALMPVFAYQEGALPSLATAGLGNPWLYAKVNLLDDTHGVQAAAGIGLGLPVGTGVAFGNGGLEVAPRLQVGKVYDAWQWGAELGFLYRPVTDYTPISGGLTDKVGSQVWLSGMVTSVSTSGPRGEVTVRLHAPLTGGSVGVESLLGVRWQVGDVELFAQAGPSFFGAPSTPDVRVYAGAAFGNTPMTQPPCVEGKPYALANCPDLDRDGDGVKNALDRAPLDAEDKDGFQDDDGVPDPDNDGDGVADADDHCRDVSGPVANHGCPDTDADKDGVVDRLDKCPTAAEDKDGFEDEDGCPDPDNDADGIADAKDACPREAGIAQEHGCPAKDSDGDAVFDFEDNCPTEKGEKANAGCPVAQKQLVVIEGAKLKILDKVYFDAGKASIQKRSNTLLDNVAQVLAAHTDFSVQVEGYTDSSGVAETNKKLSQDRADAVKAYLVKKGIADSRLKAVGFGPERPADTNDTPAGRENNRRVEFNLVSAP